jgi:hypothetical protein
VRHGLAHERIRSALVTGQHQEAWRQSLKRTGVHAPWANEAQGCDAVGMSGSQTSPVASATGRDVGARDTQVLEKLQETFFYRKFDFRYHSVPPSFGQSPTGTSSPIGMTPYYSPTFPGQTSCWVLLVPPWQEAYNTKQPTLAGGEPWQNGC